MLTSQIKNEFKKISGYDLEERYCNHYLNNEARKDRIFSCLALLYFSDKNAFRRLAKKAEVWNKINPCETTYAINGYIKYIYGDHKISKNFFLKMIKLNPDNLDSWLDLAFALRQLGEFKLCHCILFYHLFVVHYYKKFQLNKQSYSDLKKLLLRIYEQALKTDEY